ncbi:MAG: lactonase family protein [Blastocatellales bacterium]|nr:lactonase family protein [Blastocatellales bacterium]
MKIIRYGLIIALAFASMPESKSISKSESMPESTPESFSKEREWIVYAGAYTRRNSKGIYAYRFAAGLLTPIGLAAETRNPSFLAVHPNQRFLYAVGEDSAGSVSSFSIDRKTGMLRALNTVSARGSGPCHLSFDRTGKWLFVANYGSGSTVVFPVRKDGALGEASTVVQHTGSSVNPERQRGPHAHSVDISPDNRFLIVADLGLDKTLVYRFDAANGALAPNDPPYATAAPGAGPRHTAFSPGGEFVYVINEMASTVTAFAYDKRRGVLQEIHTLSALPPGFSGASSGAEIVMHPEGRFLYGSNRGHDSIAVFSADPKNGELKALDWVSTQGRTPRNFAVDPAGDFLLAANQNSNSIVVFRIDRRTGGLKAEGSVEDIDSPVSLVFAAK